jgi:hypothetical protein
MERFADRSHVGRGGIVVEDVHRAARYIPVSPSARNVVLFKGTIT